ncbi:MAG: tRNA pseudouridine(55) synthase TruB [Acidimicrobiales bacterium]
MVDKEPGWTSHDVVAKARGLLGTRKIGHAGTLDPDATGVLLLGVGKATRLLRFLSELPKAYVGELVLGSTTTTLDSAGTVTARFEMDQVTLSDVQRVSADFVGDILQVPPMVSAIKVDGRRLHELAREGIEIEREARPVRIDRIDVESTGTPGVFRLSVGCGSGTYIRSLCADIGSALGGGAHMQNLRRTGIGSFTVAEATPLANVQLLPMTEVLRDHPGVRVDEAGRAHLLAGRRAEPQGPMPETTGGGGPEGSPPGSHGGTESGHLAAYGPDGELIGMVRRAGDGSVQPVVVVADMAAMPTP